MNSSEAVALQDKATLTRDGMGKIIGQVATDGSLMWPNLVQAHLTAATDADKGHVFILAPDDGTAHAIAHIRHRYSCNWLCDYG